MLKFNSTLAKSLYKLVAGYETGNKSIDTHINVRVNAQGDFVVSTSVWRYNLHVVRKSSLTWREYKVLMRALEKHDTFNIRYHWVIVPNGWLDVISI